MRKPSYRRKRGKNKLVLFTLLFWTMMGLTSFFLLQAEDKTLLTQGPEVLGQHYLASAFPTASRGSSWSDRLGEQRPSSELEAQNGQIIASDVLNEGESAPAAAPPAEDTAAPPVEEPVEEPAPPPVVDTAVSNEPPRVLIYHTHATESYQPVSDGNFHSQEETATVREVGDILKQALEAKGISVLHDKSMHDVPSYSQSYSRSLKTAQQLLADNPSIQVVIDLHRDAAGVTGSKAYTFTYNDTASAQFSLVIGQGNANRQKLTEFATQINQKANAMYPGFARGIIEKSYRFNQHISDRAILLELGNNQNDISQVRRSAAYFGEVLASIMNEW